MDNLCVICGAIIPEGRQVCPICEKKQGPAERRDQDDPGGRADGEIQEGA